MRESRTHGTDSYTVSATVLAPFLRLCEEAGERTAVKAYRLAEEILQTRGISMASIEADSTQRLPWSVVLELYHAFVDLLDNPAAALLAGARAKPGDFQLLEYLCRSCNTIGEAIEHLGRYLPLVIEMDYELHMEGDRAETILRFPFELNVPSGWYEFMSAYLANMSMIYVVPLDTVPVREVRFTHAPPQYAQQFATIFPAPVRFNAEHDGAVFDASFMRHPLRTADPILHDILQRAADVELGLIPRLNAFITRVRVAVQEHLHQGARLESVAASLTVSPATLRRRLREYGTTFTNLLDDVRREHARRYLGEPERNIAEIAYQLGFAHPPAFHRACKRWFQQSPSEFRDSLAPHPVSRLWRQR